MEEDIVHLRRNFKLGKEIINVVEDSAHDRPAISYSRSGKMIKSVILGGPDHLSALYSKIVELRIKIAQLNHTGRPLQIPEYEKELLTNECEHAFLSSLTKNTRPEDDYDDDTESELDYEQKPILVTRESLEEVKCLKTIDLEQTQANLFSKPQFRQYFIGKVLHRPVTVVEVEWVELFCDLITVGGFFKSGVLITRGHDWEAFLKFNLVFIPLLLKWRINTALHNQILDHSPPRLFLEIVFLTLIVIMSVSIEHAFDVTAKTNTLNYFLGCNIACTLVNQMYILYVISKVNMRFLQRELARTLLQVVGMVPYILLMALFPLSGNPEREWTRLMIFVVGALLEICMIPIFSALTQKTQLNQHRLAFNVVHMSERFGLLMVVGYGVILFSAVIHNYEASLPTIWLYNSVLGVVTAVCLFYAYFRAEMEDHDRHALRRNWFSGTVWTIFHIPTAVALVTIANCRPKLAEQSASDQQTGTRDALPYNLQSLHIGSYALYFVCLGSLGLLHEHDVTNRTSIGYTLRLVIIGTRFTLGLIFLFLATFAHYSAQTWIYVNFLLLTSAVYVEESCRRNYSNI